MDNKIDKRIPFAAMYRGNVGFTAALNPYAKELVDECRREQSDDRSEALSYALLDVAVVIADLIKKAILALSAHDHPG